MSLCRAFFLYGLGVAFAAALFGDGGNSFWGSAIQGAAAGVAVGGGAWCVESALRKFVADKGETPGDELRCPACNGTGYGHPADNPFPGHHSSPYLCGWCQGSGTLPRLYAEVYERTHGEAS